MQAAVETPKAALHHAALLNTAEIFDPTTNQFTATAGTMTAARHGHSDFAAGRKVLIAGGRVTSVLSSAETMIPLPEPFRQREHDGPAHRPYCEPQQRKVLWPGSSTEY